MCLTMKERTLGRSGISLTELTLGTWGLAGGSYGAVDRRGFEGTVAAAMGLGVRAFDMAPLWGDGLAEEVVGSIVGSRRDEVVYISRAGVACVDGELRQDYEPDTIVASCEASLKRLGTDRIDVLLIHEPPHWVFKPGQVDWAKALAGLKADGRIRAWGASVQSSEMGLEALSLGADILCLPYSLLQPDALGNIADEVAENEVGVLARSPLMHGLLTGQWRSGRRFGQGDHRRHRWNVAALKTRLAQLEHLEYLVHDEVSSMRSAALRFVLANTRVGSAVVGARSPEQLRQLVADANAGESAYLPAADLDRLPQVMAAAGV